MKIHFFTCGDENTASSRVRAIQVMPKLNKLSIETYLYTPHKFSENERYSVRIIKSNWYFLKQIKNINRRDIIYLQKGGAFNKYFFIIIIFYKLLKRVKIIFDFDDAIFINTPKKTYLYMKISDHIVVGGHYLQEYAKKYHKNVSLIPTSISYSMYSRFDKNYEHDNGVPVIGWIGHGVAHYENLKILVPVFKKLIKENIEFKFLLIGAKKDKRVHHLFDIEGLNVEIIDEINWSDTLSAVGLIQKFSVGVQPLNNFLWENGKCTFKAIEYMACGVPVVSSNVGESDYLIDDGKNGFLVDSTNKWVDKIKLLIDNIDLRTRVGLAGQKTVKERYSYQVNISKLIDVFKSI